MLAQRDPSAREVDIDDLLWLIMRHWVVLRRHRATLVASAAAAAAAAGVAATVAGSASADVASTSAGQQDELDDHAGTA